MLKITKNCLDAIQRLFEDDCLTPVWIDAICINQLNSQERNHQVGLMSRIYSSANKVQIYLGHGDMNTKKALAWANREYGYLESGTPLLHFPYTDMAPPNVVAGLEGILSRSWFTRLWVLQEVHFAQYAEAFCGEDKVPWSVLRLLGQHYYDDKSDKNRLNPGSLVRIPPVLALSEQGTSRWPLSYWIAETIHLEPTDERDSIYALLSLSSDVQSGDLTLVPDYDITLSDIKLKLLDAWREHIFEDIWTRHNLDLAFNPSDGTQQVMEMTLIHATKAGLYMFILDPAQAWLFLPLIETLEITARQRTFLRDTYQAMYQDAVKLEFLTDLKQVQSSGYKSPFVAHESQESLVLAPIENPARPKAEFNSSKAHDSGLASQEVQLESALITGSDYYSTLVKAGSVISAAISSDLGVIAYCRSIDANSGIIAVGKINAKRPINVSNITEIASWNSGNGVDLALSKDGSYLAVSMRGQQNVVIYRVQSHSQFQVVGHDGQAVDMFSMSPTGRLVCIVYEKCSMVIWETDQRKNIHTVTGDSVITCVTFSHDEQFIATGYMDGSIGHFHINNESSNMGKKLDSRHEFSVIAIAFSPNNLTIASATMTGQVIISSGNTSNVIPISISHDDALCGLSFNADGRFLLVASVCGTLNLPLWLDIKNWTITKRNLKRSIRRVTFSSNKSRSNEFAIVHRDGAVQIEYDFNAVVVQHRAELLPSMGAD